MEYTKEQLRERYRKIPDELQEAFDSIETVQAIQTIGKKYNLHIDQLGKISDEIGLVILGLSKPKDFTLNIKNKAGIPEDMANLVTYDVNQTIIVKIRNALQQLNEPKNENSKTEIPGENIFSQKMTAVHNQAKEEVEVKDKNSDNKEEGTIKTSFDPYREPLK